MADFDAVEAGANVFAVLGPVGGFAHQDVVDPDGGVGDVALDAKTDGAGRDGVRASGGEENQQNSQNDEAIGELVFHGTKGEEGAAAAGATAAGAGRNLTRTRIESPDTSTLLKVITAPLSRDSAVARAAPASRVRTRISDRPPAMRRSSAEETLPRPRNILSSAVTAAGSTMSASTVTARRSALSAPAALGRLQLAGDLR